MTQSYFQLNQDNYRNLVEQLLDETAAIVPSLDASVIDARRQFIVASIAKAAPLAEIPKTIAKLDAANLIKQAQAIPDKASNGWSGKTSITEDNRKLFASSGESRADEMRWDNLFPDGKDEIYLPLSSTARSLEDKVDAFIEKHNSLAVSKFAAAQELDKQTLIENPKAFAKAGNADDQKQIRRDPSNPSKMLQTWHPGRANPTWSPPQSIEKFLQKQFEWAIYDNLQKEGQSKDKTAPLVIAPGKATFRDIANREQIAADPLLDEDSLVVVISRDPQKIGEMSTGQRWRSCMATDGINFQFVPNDIQAGSLVAYVVEKSDPDARYPLMRQLIKPFRNESGETILAPARIYGGMENTNSRTRDALQTVLNEFVKRQNDGKSGEFNMDPSLYGDGQSPVARLQGDWTPDSIFKALHNYQNSAITEWLVELRHEKADLLHGIRRLHGDTASERAAELKSSIRRVLTVDDLADGLPRMFYREMRKTSIGSIPEPGQIAEASLKYSDQRSVAFHAISKMDLAQIKQITETAGLAVIANSAFLAAVTAKSGTAAEKFAADVWGAAQESQYPIPGFESGFSQQALTYAAVRRAEEYLEGAILATAGSELDRVSTQGFISAAEEIQPLATRVSWYAKVVHQELYNGELRQLSLQSFRLAVDAMESPEERVKAYQLLATGNNPDLKQEAVNGLLQNVELLSNTNERGVAYMEISRLAKPQSEEEHRAAHSFDVLTKSLEPQDRLWLYAASVNGSVKSSKLLRIGIAGILVDNHYEPDLAERCENYREVANVAERDSPEQLTALEGILQYVYAVDDGPEKITRYYDLVIEKALPGSDTYRHAVEGKFASMGLLPDKADRITQSVALSYGVDDSTLRDKLLSYALDEVNDMHPSDALNYYSSIANNIDRDTPLARRITIAALEAIVQLDDPIKRLECERRVPHICFDADVTKKRHQVSLQAADLITDPLIQFEAYRSVGGWSRQASPEKDDAISKMLQCASTLNSFEAYNTIMLYADNEQSEQAIKGALNCLKEDKTNSPEERLQLYMKVLPYTTEGSLSQTDGLERFLDLQETLPPKTQLQYFLQLTRHALKSSCLFTAGVTGQLRMFEKVADPATRIDALSELRIEICNATAFAANEKTFGPLLVKTGDMLLDAVTTLPTPQARVDAAKLYVKSEYSWMCDREGEFHKQEIKNRGTAERIVMAQGSWPLPAHRAGSRLMSFFDRDDVSHIMYRAAETLESTLHGLSTVCQIVHPPAKHTAVNNSYGAALSSAPIQAQGQQNQPGNAEPAIFSPSRRVGLQS